MQRALDAGSWMTVAARAIGVLTVLLPVGGTVFILARMSRRIGKGAWRAADRVPAGRFLLAPLSLAAVVGLAYLWWPNGEYRPIQRGEKGTLAEVVRSAREIPTGRPGLTEERESDLGGAPARADEAPTEEPATATTTTTVFGDEDRDEIVPRTSTSRRATSTTRFDPDDVGTTTP
jgi:hypothetical protein